MAATPLCSRTIWTRRVVPVLLYPLPVTHLTSRPTQRHKGRRRNEQERLFHSEPASTATQDLPIRSQVLDLPRSCPGCGAYSQLVSPDQPGFYSMNRKSVKTFLARYEPPRSQPHEESATFCRSLAAADTSLLSQLGVSSAEDTAREIPEGKDVPVPICNRCHQLTHHHTGVPVIHPTIRSIQEIIEESPHKYNHIYHVLDAADFPLSLIPSLQRTLSLAPQRGQNRRAKTSHFQYGRQAEVSFIITRSDLLAPKKEQVDTLMPYIVQVLRDALGASADNARLGNVRCVSSKRGWWTKQVKEEIWNRGGGGWMIGKVNVGKSGLFENVFPKGRTEDINFDSLRRTTQQGPRAGVFTRAQSDSKATERELQFARPYDALQQKDETNLLDDSLLPPAPPEIPFPVMPVVSSLPGTTASPIRLPFGNGKGELVDLPGLPRGDLESFITENHRLDFVMRHRIKPEQLTIKPGQSLLIGGLVSITPLTPEVTMLAYPFVPLNTHVASTERIKTVHTRQELSGIPTIARPGAGTRMHSAGIFPLKWDVTKKRAGPLTNPAAAGLKAQILPFIVFSLDVLIEGCGWVEIVAQVRRKLFEAESNREELFDDRPYPRIEVVSPDGRHIGVRRPMAAWLLNGDKPGSSSKSTIRPRRSMKGVKKRLKEESRVGRQE